MEQNDVRAADRYADSGYMDAAPRRRRAPVHRSHVQIRRDFGPVTHDCAMVKNYANLAQFFLHLRFGRLSDNPLLLV